jgi:DNA-binding transcriptional LysR family regulator
MTDLARWDDLRLLLEVARAGSCSAAALALGVSQPTVSRRLAALSRRLGTALTRREGGRLELSAAGRRVLPRVERMEREALALARDLDRLDERPGGAVRLTAPDGLGLGLLAPALPAFRRAHPEVDLLLVAEAQLVNLSRREADLAVRFVRPRQRELLVRKVADVPFALYASPAYLRDRPRGEGGGLGPDDDLVALHEALGAMPEAAWVRAHAGGARVRLRVRTTLALRAALTAGAGIGLLPDYLGEDPSLRPVSRTVLTRPVYLVFHRGLRHLARVRAVAQFVVACLVRPAGTRPQG